MKGSQTISAKSSRSSNYLKGLGTGYLTAFVTIAVGLWLTPFTLRFLDREEYAIFALASDLLMWLGLLDLGITAGLSVQAAQLFGKQDSKRLNQLASTAFFAQIIIVIVVLVVGLILAQGFPYFMELRQDLQKPASIVISMLVIGSAIGFTTKTYSSLLIANQQIHFDNLLRLALLVLRTGLTVILLIKGLGLYSLAIASLFANIVTSAVAIWRAYRYIPKLEIRWSLASWDGFSSLGTLGGWFSIGGIAGIVITSIDRMVAAKLISVDIVTTLSLTGRVYLLFGSLLDQITNTARPMLGQMMGQHQYQDALRVYSQLFRLSTGLAVVAATSLWAGNESFIGRWVGSENFGGSLLSLTLAINLIVHSWVLPSRAVLSSALMVRQQSLSRALEAILNLGLSLLLGYYMGIIGIVISTAIAGLLTSMWYLPLLTARLLERPWYQFYRSDALPVLVVAAMLAPVSWVMNQAGNSLGGVSGAIVASATTGIIGVGILWRVGLDQESRGLVRQYYAKFKPGRRV